MGEAAAEVTEPHAEAPMGWPTKAPFASCSDATAAEIMVSLGIEAKVLSGASGQPSDNDAGKERVDEDVLVRFWGHSPRTALKVRARRGRVIEKGLARRPLEDPLEARGGGGPPPAQVAKKRDKHDVARSQHKRRDACVHARRRSRARGAARRALIMTWIESWDTFYAEAEKLFLEHPQHVSLPLPPRRCATSTTPGKKAYPRCLLPPAQTRYVTKYRHVDGKLELKVTNDRVCLKFLTDQQQDLKRIDKLNNLLLTHMVGIDPYAEPAEEQGRPTSGGDLAKTSSVDDAAGGASGAAGKKKKTKK